MKLSVGQLSLISSLYDAAIDRSRWVGLLDRLAAEVGAKGSAIAVLETFRHYSLSINLSCSLYSQDDKRIYESSYAGHEAAHWANVARSPPGQIVLDEAYIRDPTEFRKRPDVAYLEQRYGVFERFAIKLNDEKAWFDSITFQYDTNRSNITRCEAEILAAFVPHIAKTIDLSRSFAELKNRYSAVLGVLDRLLVGIFLVFESSKVLLANATARRMIEEKAGLAITRFGELRVDVPRSDRQLKAGIQAACAAASGIGAGGSTRLVVAKRSGRDHYLIDVSPLRDTHHEIQSRYEGAIVVVVDPDLSAPTRMDGLEELYSLTRAEAVVAQHIVSGKTNNEIAEIRRTSPETVRKQVRTVLSKTNSRNRTELVSRLLTIHLPIE